MSAEIIQFVPRARRTPSIIYPYGKPAYVDPLSIMAMEIMNQVFPGEDTAPAEFCAPDGDCA